MVESIKKGTGKQFTICTSEARHVKPLLQALIEENKGWKETLLPDKYDFKWFCSSVDDRDLVEALKDKGHMVNRIPGIQGLAHKDTYTRLMRIGSEIDADMVNSFVPEQFIFPRDSEKFLGFHKKCPAGTTFIAKPVASSEGNSILLFRDLSEIPSMLSAEMVVQRYIHNPLLVDGLKFDLRVYVVIIGTEPLSAFICNEGLARFCTEKYEKPTRENFKQFYMHLTNYSINKHSDDFQQSEDILLPNNATKRTITSLMLTLQAMGVDTEKLNRNIAQTCSRALSVYAQAIEHGLAVATNCKTLDGKYFQVLGFDVLPDEDLNCYLLEINDHPSLDIFLDKAFMGGGLGQTLSKIDLHVKKTVLGDTVKLTKKPKVKIAEITQYRSLRKILSIEDDDQASQVHETLGAVRNLYLQIAPVKSKELITSSNFETILTKSEALKATGLTKVDMNLLFQKISESQKQVDFLCFFWMIKRLHDVVKERGCSLSDDIGEFINEIRQQQ